MVFGSLTRVSRSRLDSISILLVVLASLAGPRVIVAQESTPVASPIVFDEPYDPLLLFEGLLQSQLPQQWWPSTAVNAVAQPWLTSDATLEGSVAAVQITFEGAESFAIAYAIYPTEEEATASLERAAAGSGGLATPSPLPAEINAPGVILDYGSFKVCLIQVNNVIVDGVALDADSATNLAQVGAEHLNQVAQSLPAPSATPAAGQGVLGDLTPEALRDRLVASTFSGTGIPSYLQNPQIAAWIDETDTDLIGTTGAATVTFTGGEGGIAYLIFPSETAAKVRVVTSAAAERAAGHDPQERSDLRYPALILVSDDGVTCVLQVGYVVIAGYSPMQEEDVEKTTADAVALALAGAEHLVSLASSD